MPDNFTGSFTISVQGATNPTLGQNGQGVCGVIMHFDHEYLGDLSITLTSPSGQSVQLVGPIGFFGATDGTDWNITFLPCGDPAVAPDPGFTANWNNNQPWGLGNMYTGSYYPAAGCLQNFSGAVNGTWTLTVVDGQQVDVGNFYNYEIIFCDPDGINCFSCGASAGILPQSDVIACEGSASLNLSLPPFYNPPNTVAPPAGEYSYTYMISAFSGGVIQAFDQGPDLTGLPVGVYNVCGLSYLTAQESSIPTPNGVLTATQLNNQLNSGQPPFCGDITTNCVKVTINAAPPDEEDYVTICSPDCYLYHGQNYCVSGTYVKNLTAANCDYTATLHLTVVNIPPTNLTEIICQGECAQTPGFENYCIQGQYTEIFDSYQDCDSLVKLTLTVLSPLANIVPPGVLGCGQSSMPLQGLGSSTGGGLTYAWSTTNGAFAGPTNTINTAVTAPGDYQLKVCKFAGGVSCCDSAMATVTLNQNPPAAPAAINGISSLCVGQTVSLTATPVGGVGTYTWTVPPGVVINSGQGNALINITWNNPAGGDVCVTFTNACGTSSATCIPITVNQPAIPTTPTGAVVVCAGVAEAYQTTLNPNATNYIWTVTAPATITSGQGTNAIIVNWGNVTTGSVCIREVSVCGTSQPVCLPVQINITPASPVVTGSNVGCTSGVSNYSITAVSGATSYDWQVTGGTITGGAGTTSIQVTWNASGTAGSVCASAVNACGTSPSNCINVTLGAPPAQPNISGTAAVCAGTNGTYTIPAIPGISTYTWTVPAGATIISGQNSTTLNVAWMAAPGGTVCVSANSSCGAGPQDCFPVVVTPQPVANAGMGGSICGTSFNLQATPSISGSTGTWLVVPGGPGTATFTNVNNATTTVTVSQNGTYMFIWEEQIQTCTSDDSLTVNFNAEPTIGQINHSCDGTAQNYVVTFPITGGLAPYTVPGGTVSNGLFTSNQISSGQPFSFQVTDANGCLSIVQSGSFDCNCTTNAGMMNLQQLSGCEGDTLTAQHAGGETLDADDVSAFVLHTSAGTSLGTVLAQNTSGVFPFQTGMAYETVYYVSFVVGNNLNGFPNPADPCFSVAQGQPVIWHQNPVANAGPDADTCGLSLTLTGNTGTGLWTVVNSPAGGQLAFSDPQSGGTSATATDYGIYQLAWTVQNQGCSGADTVQLIFNGSPVAGLLTTDCSSTNLDYTVSIPLTGGTPPYSVNGQPVSGTTFTSAPISSGTAYTFLITDANGCSTDTVTGSFLCNCTSQAGTMDLQALFACAGSSLTATHLGGENLDGNDVTSYVLHTNSGAMLDTVFAENTTGTFVFQNGMTYGQTYYISFVVGSDLNGLPDPNDPCLSVAPGQPVVFYQNPVANAGLDADTCGLSLMLSGSAGTGQWTVNSTPTGGLLVFTDDLDPQTAVSTAVTGTYDLTWTVTANGCVSTDQVVVQFHSSPSLVDAVRSCDAINENFTVTLTLTGGTPPYTVNGSPVAGNTFVSAAFPNGGTYTFAISDANGCSAPDVTGAYSCNCSTSAGTMDATVQTVCEGLTITATANNDQSLDGNDITAYVLHDGSGPALGNVLAENTTGVFAFQAGMIFGKTYYISLVAGNPLNGLPNPLDPCFSVATGQPVIWLQNPSPNAGSDAAVCGTVANLQAATGSFSGLWSQVSGTGTATFSAAGNPASSATASLPGTYIFRWTETNGICVVSDDVTINFNEVPAINALTETCDGTNTLFTVTFTVAGGTAPFTVNGLTGTFSASDFTSALLPNNSLYDFEVVDANGCSAGEISGSKNCLCTTDAGSMVVAPLTFCADQPATAVWNNDGTLDANDMVQFILHSTSGTTLGTVYATAAQPSFPFNANLQPGVVYYISAISGNNVNGSVELTDDCLSVAPGTAVQWKLLPTATLSGDATLCAGSSTFLSFSGTGSYPLQLTYTGENGSPATLNLTGIQTVSLNVGPASSTVYTLTNVTDGTLPACSVALNVAATVQVNQPVEAGTAAAPLKFCAGLSQSVQLAQQLSGADTGGSWTEISTTPSTAGAFNAPAATFKTNGQAPGTYQFRYALVAAAPCTNDEVVVTVVINPTPVANAGTDKTLDCNVASVVLGGANTTGGTGISYQWTLNASVTDTTKTVTTSTPGLYTLLVSSTAGCSATDQVLVILDSELPFASVKAKGLRCFGDKNGSILVDSLVTTHPPVLFSLNGGPFVSGSVFYPLLPGTYTVTLQDVRGCEWTADVQEVIEPAQLLANLGPDIELMLGDTALVELQVSQPFSALDTIIWSPLLDTANSGQLIQQWFPTQSQQVGVHVVDNSGCAANDRLTIFLNKMRHVFVPNIFDPNSPPNDVVTVFGGRDVEEVEVFRIYDRWGEQLYELLNSAPNNIPQGWNGKFKGQEVNPGVYAYYTVVRFKDGEKEIFTGDITVYR